MRLIALASGRSNEPSGLDPCLKEIMNLTGQLPHNTQYLGHERVSKDGYVEVSIDEVYPHTGYGRRYLLKHVHKWEKANGPVPDGLCLKCVDGEG
jgi:hypothetical protein